MSVLNQSPVANLQGPNTIRKILSLRVGCTCAVDSLAGASCLYCLGGRCNWWRVVLLCLGGRCNWWRVVRAGARTNHSLARRACRDSVARKNHSLALRACRRCEVGALDGALCLASASFDTNVGRHVRTVVSKASRPRVWFGVDRFDQVFDHESATAHPANQLFPTMQKFLGSRFADQ